MEQKTAVFLKSKFREYYAKHTIPAPPGISYREFGIGNLEKKIAFRHKSFKSESELNYYLKTEVPFYISYSAAYYEFPENEISKKNWLGADLIFDFDAEMDFIEIEKIKKIWDEVLKLIDFLKNDFGFSMNNIIVNFSGSKGFHVKVIDEKIKKLGKEERRQILDYITANNLLKDIRKNKFFKYKEIGSGTEITNKKRKGVETKTEILIGPTIDDVGWGRRIANAAIEILKEDENNKRLGEEKRKKAKEIIEDINKGNYDRFRQYLTDKRMKDKIRNLSIRLASDTDRQVTQDITRLIRLENTLHGGTGLIAKKIDNIENFEPEKNFEEFIAFSDKEIEISVNEDINFYLGENFEIKKGKCKIPEYAAIYLALKGKCEIL